MDEMEKGVGETTDFGDETFTIGYYIVTTTKCISQWDQTTVPRHPNLIFDDMRLRAYQLDSLYSHATHSSTTEIWTVGLERCAIAVSSMKAE